MVNQMEDKAAPIRPTITVKSSRPKIAQQTKNTKITMETLARSGIFFFTRFRLPARATAA